MPAGVVKTKRDEVKWNKAKSLVHKQYPNLSEDDSSFWKLVNSIYQNMKKAHDRVDTRLLKKATEISFLCPDRPLDLNSFIISNYYLLYAHREEMLKANYKLQGRMKLHGMDISIENRKGGVRRGKDENGHEWRTKMKYPYGYIRLTEGADGEHVDCYIGDDRECRRVFVIHQNNPYKEGKPYDEDKVMIGFSTPEIAKKAYLQHYDRPDFFGSMEEWDVDDFRNHVKKKKGKITGGDLLKAAVKIKQSYTKEDLEARNLRWVTVRGNHVLVQGLEDGSYVVVGGAGGKLNHFKIDKLLSEEEYKEKAKEKKKATTELSKQDIKTQIEKRKKEVELKRKAREQYTTAVKDILGLDKKQFRSKITAQQMEEIEERAIENIKRKTMMGQLKKQMSQDDVDEETEKIVKEEEEKMVKDAESKAVNLIASEFFGDELDPNEKAEIKELLDADKAMEILKAKKNFRKVLKDIGASKIEKIEDLPNTFAADSKTIKDDILEEVEKHIETKKNIQLYDQLNAQSLNVQKQIDIGVLNALNGITGDLFNTSAMFSEDVIENIGLEACVALIASQLKREGKSDMAKQALAEYAKQKNFKTVSDTLTEVNKRFNYADKLRKMGYDYGSSEAILSKASANGYSLRQVVRAQQLLGTAIGQLRTVAHLLNKLDETKKASVNINMGTDLTRARKKAKKAGFKRNEYKITSKDGNFIMEISEDNLGKFFDNNKVQRKKETLIEKIKKKEANTGYKPPGIKDEIILDESQEAGLLFFKEQGKVLLDFEAGLGKTANAYAAAMEAIHNKGVKKVLIVVPAKLRSQMKKESQVFLDKANQDKVILNDKGPKDRAKNYKKDGIIIIGHDQLRTDMKLLKEAGFGLVIIDEIHEITNPEIKKTGDSGRFKGMMALKDTPYKLIMSGTDIKNSKTELYKKIDFLDPDHTLGTLKEFNDKYKGLNQGSGALQSSSMDTFRKEVSPYMFSQKSKLPVDNHIHEVSVPLSKEQKKLYKESENLYTAEKKEGKKGAAARRESRNYDIIHNGMAGENSKIQNIIDIMEKNHKQEKAVIHVYRRKALETAKLALEKKYGIGSVGVIHGDTPKNEAEKIKEKFNDPADKLKFIIGTKSLEAGHNLQFGGTVTFHLDIPNTAAAFDQRNKRVYRKKQTKDTNTYLLLSESPFDMAKKEIMERKGREMGILGNPSDIEQFDEDGFLSILNNLKKKKGAA